MSPAPKRAHMKRYTSVFWPAAFLLGMAVTWISGCSREGQVTSPAKPQVALVMKSLANEFFSTMEDGAKKHQAAQASRYDLIVNGIKNETDLAEQVNLV